MGRDVPEADVRYSRSPDSGVNGCRSPVKAIKPVGAFFCNLAPSIGSPLRLERQLDANKVAINNRHETIADGCYTAGVKASLCCAFLVVELHSPGPD